MGNLDGLLNEDWQRSPNTGVAWFLCTSLLYYRDDVSIISDTSFDRLCHDMLDQWGTITHPHKRFIAKPMLVAGTGHNLTWRRLPLRVHGGAAYLRDLWESTTDA